ncbi:DUF433 domain-containing protein [Rhodoplanes sp. TEM]|uniref:DUF433 domain-containing protein n=1 Tax=Rhodoplanes tepidamans TaxID=200616 RepID=A0ABT5JEK1_RHOTP|nr:MULTISPECIES: DUF433 domain-containing protein [Rhodoplanes]MDC7788057.1 DUF433 domain-containing protein [Rhodoplanes tepidamans]MDC7987532.1 DUF433 domain-containing protein [Rhodoplanes sp. TEM]MDQ0353954.1 uncharacterized protein (DUF433 family) [Rhodoplanes tepidamans]
MTDGVVRLFSEEHVTRLTGLSLWQLRAWDREGFFAPRYAYEDRRTPYSRIYSFKDVVGLRAIAVLMKSYGVSFQELRKVAAELKRRGFDHWAELKLYVVKKQVHFQRPESRDVEGVWDGQLALVPVIDVIMDVETRVQKLQHRDPEQYGKVEKRRHTLRNAPVVAGTRIPTAAIRRFHEAGYSIERILGQYPTLKEADVYAALEYEQGLAQSA